MAGIGFELKKLFNKEGIAQRIRAYSFSTVITVGPALLCSSLIFLLQSLLQGIGVDCESCRFIGCAIVYGFIFSQLITSGLSMILSRYLADKIYMKEYDEILPSFYGVLILCLPIVGIIGGVFYFLSPIHDWFKLFAYTFMLEMVIIWVQTAYLSALKNFRQIMASYLYGFMTTFVCFYLLLRLNLWDPMLSAILSINIGYLVTLIKLMAGITSYLRVGKKSGNYFKFFSYIRKHYELALINLFYVLGLYVHNFIYWGSDYSVVIAKTYRIAPFYDIAVFYAFMAALPSMVYFVVRTETSFYDQYRKYYYLIVNEGNYGEIQNAKKVMIDTAWNEIRNITEMQLLVATLFIIGGYVFSSKIGVTAVSFEIYIILVLGVFASSIMYIILLLLLYYDDKRGALLIAAVFAGGNFLLTLMNLLTGSAYHGFGFFAAAIIAVYIGFLRLSYYLNHIDYYTFSAQAIIFKEA